MNEKKLIAVVVIVAFCLCAFLSFGIVCRSKMRSAARANDIAVLAETLGTSIAKSNELVARREFELAAVALRELEPTITTMRDVKLEEQLQQAMRDIVEAKRDYKKKFKKGYSVFEGKFISKEKKDRLIAEREAVRQERLHKEQKEQEEARERARQEAEERNLQEQAKAKLQKGRKQFIQKLINEGYWLKTEFTGSLPKLWVTKKFLLNDEISQNEVLSVVYAYWADELKDFGNHGFYWDPIILKLDTGTILGRRVGIYDPVNGIKIE